MLKRDLFVVADLLVSMVHKCTGQTRVDRKTDRRNCRNNY